MSAIGALSGEGVYSTLEYKGRKFLLSQWTLGAMEAVSQAAFLKAAQAVRMMGGSEKAVASREVALARSFALGAYDFDAIVVDNGFVDNDLLATFLHKLLSFHDATINLALALEMVKDNWQLVIEAVNKANPRTAGSQEKGEAQPAQQNESGNPSVNHGVTS